MVYATVKSASSKRIRTKAYTAAPRPSAQRQEKKQECLEQQEAIDAAVNEWFSYTIAKADDLASRFQKKPRYFLDIFFQGGARMVHHHSKVNSFNAFKSLKSRELNEGSSLIIGPIHVSTTNIHMC